MSLTHDSVEPYWDEARVRLEEWLAKHRDLDAEALN